MKSIPKNVIEYFSISAAHKRKSLEKASRKSSPKVRSLKCEVRSVFFCGKARLLDRDIVLIYSNQEVFLHGRGRNRFDVQGNCFHSFRSVGSQLSFVSGHCWKKQLQNRYISIIIICEWAERLKIWGFCASGGTFCTATWDDVWAVAKEEDRTLKVSNCQNTSLVKTGTS